MRKFIFKSFCLIIPLFLFLFYLEYKLGKIQNSYSFKRQHLEKQLDSIEVLVLGSSQVTYGINPEFFRLNGFNLSNISQSLYYDTRLTLNYIDKMPKLKYVIISISYFSFGFQTIDGIEAWRDYYYSQFWDINFPEIQCYDLKRYSKIFLYTPKMSLSYCKYGFNIHLIENFKPNGYLWVDTANNKLNISDSLGCQRVLFHNTYYKDSRVAENQKDLELLVSELKKRNVIPVLVTLPVFSTYSKFADKSVLRKNNDYINYICKKYACDYFNYFSDVRFVQGDFKDNDHLNFVGAQKFSKIVNDEILEKNKKTCQIKIHE